MITSGGPDYILHTGKFTKKKKNIHTFSLQNIYDSAFESTKTHIKTFLHHFLEIFQNDALKPYWFIIYNDYHYVYLKWTSKD